MAAYNTQKQKSIHQISTNSFLNFQVPVFSQSILISVPEKVQALFHGVEALQRHGPLPWSIASIDRLSSWVSVGGSMATCYEPNKW